MALYDNVLRSEITKVTARPEMFPCAEVTGWIFPRVDTIGMLMNDTENKSFASFSLTFLSAAYNLPEKEVSVTTEWVKGLNFDYTTKARIMMVDGKFFRNKQSGEYKTTHLKNPIHINIVVVEQDLWQSQWEVLQIWMDCTDIPHSYERNSFQLG